MEAELGLELAKCLDEFVSTTPIFNFNFDETDTRFLLTAILKGYGREQIKIDVNEYGKIIVVSGEKPFQDMVMVGWQVYKKETKMRGFTKAFKIPDNVIFDRINATFNQDSFKLTISLPKMMEGVKGTGFKEVKEEEIGIGDYISLQLDAAENDEEIQNIVHASGPLPEGPQQVKEVHNLRDEIKDEVVQDENSKLNKGLEVNATTKILGRKTAAVEEYVQAPAVSQVEREMAEKVSERASEKHSIQEHEALKCDHNGMEKKVYGVEGEASDTTEEKVFSNEPSTKIEKTFRDQSIQTDPPRKIKKCCTPMIAGSALVVSLLVFVIHLIKDQEKQKKKK